MAMGEVDKRMLEESRKLADLVADSSLPGESALFIAFDEDKKRLVIVCAIPGLAEELRDHAIGVVQQQIHPPMETVIQ